MNNTIKRLIIKAYDFVGISRCKKREPMKPMGIKSTVYPPGYIPPVKRVLSDGTVEYYIPVEAVKNLDQAWSKLGKETIKGGSMKKVIISDPGDEIDNINQYV